MAIPLSERRPKDMITWAFTEDGNYSVKITYMLGKGFDLDEFHEAWVTIWRVEASPNFCLVLFRLCTATLPMKALLMHGHLIDEALFP